MASRTLARGFLLILLSSGLRSVPLAACEPPLIEEVAARAHFIGRVVPISTIAVKGSQTWSERFETRARVVDGLRGSTGVVTLVSDELLPEQEVLIFGGDCGEWCEAPGTYSVTGSFSFDLSASALLGGDWFEVSSDGFPRVDLEVLRAQTVEGSTHARQVVSWRALNRMISGADAYVACRDEARSLDSAECSALEEADQRVCWDESWDELERRVAACER